MSKVFALGGAQTDFERNWTKEGKNFVAMMREVLEDGCKDAGITFEQIRQLNKENRIACFVGNFEGDLYNEQGHIGSLLTQVDPAFYGVPSARYEAACASGSVALDAAQAKLQLGDYDVAIVLGWELMKSVNSKIGGTYLGHAAYFETEAKGIDLPFPKLFGRLADAYVDRYGDEERIMSSLARISEINYANGKRNPNAQTRKWFMSYEQANMRGTDTNPCVGGRLAISDCSQVTDGAAVVVLCNEKFKKEMGITEPTPVIKGYGTRVAPLEFDLKLEDCKDEEYILPWTRQTVLDAYKRAGLTVDDIDFFETHDCFTSSEYAAISAFGLTAPGKEYEAVEAGRIAFDGDKPINASGGLIACGHPVGASGVRMFLDLCKQIKGKAGGYQLKKADTGLMLNIGGSATTNYVFIVGKE